MNHEDDGVISRVLSREIRKLEGELAVVRKECDQQRARADAYAVELATIRGNKGDSWVSRQAMADHAIPHVYKANTTEAELANVVAAPASSFRDEAIQKKEDAPSTVGLLLKKSKRQLFPGSLLRLHDGTEWALEGVDPKHDNRVTLKNGKDELILSLTNFYTRVQDE